MFVLRTLIIIIREMKDNEGLDCDNQDGHNYQISYICIDQSCQLNRQVCGGCLNRHRSHNIYTIDKSAMPLKFLSRNSFEPSSGEYYQYCLDKLAEIEKEWEKLEKIFKIHKQQIKQEIEKKIGIIMKTFNRSSATDASQLLKDSYSTKEAIEKCIQQMKILSDDKYKNIEKLFDQIDSISTAAKNSINHSCKHIKYVFNTIHSKVKDHDSQKAQVRIVLQKKPSTLPLNGLVMAFLKQEQKHQKNEDNLEEKIEKTQYKQGNIQNNKAFVRPVQEEKIESLSNEKNKIHVKEQSKEIKERNRNVKKGKGKSKSLMKKQEEQETQDVEKEAKPTGPMKKNVK